MIAGSAGLVSAGGLEALQEADDRLAIVGWERFECLGDARRAALMPADRGFQRGRAAVVEVGRTVGDAPERRRLPLLRQRMVVRQRDIGDLGVSAPQLVRV